MSPRSNSAPQTYALEPFWTHDIYVFFLARFSLLAKSYRLLSEFELQNFNDTQLLKNTDGEIDQLRGWKKRTGNRIMYSILKKKDILLSASKGQALCSI